MKTNQSVQPGWFFRGRQQYLALSEVPRTMNLTASEVTDAVSLGELRIERVSGCKVVALEELFSWIEEREGK
ncbi:hypothetical protein [Marinobacter qingdaonensis]|uniref:DNA-binding protein n=1 Tax=Marinobacter qingdaonensis TaxID=3108486 RepID=A0ABU5P1M4_9GAMM|nr:hypothetical protein [Marinobacter sp. ASW11-75]MEA1081978.1 hypothetical protein [Marinobacter sp. ASW11-75]